MTKERIAWLKLWLKASIEERGKDNFKNTTTLIAWFCEDMLEIIKSFKDSTSGSDTDVATKGEKKDK
jgi:hypothetical protein